LTATLDVTMQANLTRCDSSESVAGIGVSFDTDHNVTETSSFSVTSSNAKQLKQLSLYLSRIDLTTPTIVPYYLLSSCMTPELPPSLRHK